MIYLAVDSRHALERTDRPAPRQRRLGAAEGQGRRAARPPRGRNLRARPPEDAERCPLDHDLVVGRPGSSTITSTAFTGEASTRSCSPNAAGNPIARELLQQPLQARARRRQTCRAGSTISDTRAWRWPSPRAPTRRRSRRGWVTARSRSRSTGTATCSQSSTRRWRAHSTPVFAQLGDEGRALRLVDDGASTGAGSRRSSAGSGPPSCSS